MHCVLCSAFGKSRVWVYIPYNAVHFSGSHFSKSWSYLEIMIPARLQLDVPTSSVSKRISL